MRPRVTPLSEKAETYSLMNLSRSLLFRRCFFRFLLEDMPLSLHAKTQHALRIPWPSRSPAARSTPLVVYDGTAGAPAALHHLKGSVGFKESMSTFWNTDGDDSLVHW